MIDQPITNTNPWSSNRGLFDIDDPRNILADHEGPLTKDVILKFNRAKPGINGSGPILADEDKV